MGKLVWKFSISILGLRSQTYSNYSLSISQPFDVWGAVPSFKVVFLQVSRNASQILSQACERVRLIKWNRAKRASRDSNSNPPGFPAAHRRQRSCWSSTTGRIRSGSRFSWAGIQGGSCPESSAWRSSGCGPGGSSRPSSPASGSISGSFRSSERVLDA